MTGVAFQPGVHNRWKLTNQSKPIGVDELIIIDWHRPIDDIKLSANYTDYVKSMLPGNKDNAKNWRGRNGYTTQIKSWTTEFLSKCVTITQIRVNHRHPNQLEIQKLKKYLIYLAPCVSLFIECDFWVGPGDFEWFVDGKSPGPTQKSHSMNKNTQGAR